ncbi:cytochrome b [Acidimangrovimonas pyrenivorans]|uniref:Cytochrome b n=1 Tax=Acidimangrovimonas pyrenivorans TaxID=2030798 RepID=A0ABV7AB16_9RHOB
MSTVTGYSKGQIRLHWIVAALIVIQYVFHDAISHAWRAIGRGLEVEFSPMILLHVVAGVAIGLLALWRLAIRARRGAPKPPAGGNPVQDLLAAAVHWLLYALMLALPLTGLIAWFGGVRSMGEAHELLKGVLLILVGLHVLGALVHQFVLKDGLMLRMKRPAD